MAIHDFIAARNRLAASDWLTTLQATCRALDLAPLQGRTRDDLGPRLRSVAVGHYLVIYRPTAQGVEIARVVDGRRDMPALFKR